MKNKSKALKLGIYYAACVLILFITYYFALPPLNFQSKAFWEFITFAAVLGALPFGITLKKPVKTAVVEGRTIKLQPSADFGVKLKLAPILAFAIPIGLMIILSIASSTFFNAKRFASVISVQTAEFAQDMPETENVTNIALMDSSSAAVIGNRTLGSLSNVVSQYEIAASYTQINYQRKPQKVANLEYADFFKWINKKGEGIPGFVMVDPVNNEAKYVELTSPMKYADSGYFSDDLMRKLRFSYPTKIFGTPRFEIDESGEPFYIVPCMKARVVVFGAMDVAEVIIFNPCTGGSTLYNVADVPAWVDIVYSGDLATEKYNWYGMYSRGFWNSKFGNVDCKRTTSDYGYIVIEDDVWYFTGVTSVNSDESNIGFIITNARTGEYKFYPVVGAEEYSAMNAAQGEVQEKRYTASFPSLINVSGNATYIMVLKDAGGLVKLYALVNVENYSIVATGQTQQEAMAAYKKLLAASGATVNDKPDETMTAVVTVSEARVTLSDGASTVYITGTDEAGGFAAYKRALAEDESLMLVKPGDRLSITFAATDVERIYRITSWDYAK